jgi:hypothetical protein
VSNRLVRIFIGAAVVIAAAFAARQIAVGPDGFAAFRPVSASELAGRAEAHLYFPGSVVLQRSMTDMTGPLLSTGEPAGIAATAVTNAAKNDVIAWYENQMQSRGWSPTCGGACNPTSRFWSRGNREFFELYFLDSKSFDYRSTDRATEYVVGYGLAALLGIEWLIGHRGPSPSGPGQTGQLLRSPLV